jgi:hypothetical protein
MDRLYFINNPTTALDTSLGIVSSLVQSIETTFPTATRQGPWSLQYRVFRDTIPPGTTSVDAEGKPKAFAHALKHLLHLSNLDQHQAYICNQSPTTTAVVTGIPLHQQEAHATLVRHQFAALWQLRHVLSLQQGGIYSAGLCTIQLGELRSIREGPQSGGIPSPGVVVCISTVVGSDSDEEVDTGSDSQAIGIGSSDDEAVDFDYAEAIIRDCWNKIKGNRDLKKSDIREVMMTQEYVKGIKEKEAAVRMWCEVLRLRV